MTDVSSLTIVAHHGSPGTPDDFKLLLEALNEYNWHCADRNSGDKGPGEGHQIQLGYSWGSTEAVSAALRNPDSTIGVVLIAPFMFVDKKMSPAIKTLLSLPFVGSFLLSKMAPKSIDKMIIDSSFPQEPPVTYLPCKELYSNPDVLRPALFEKDIPTQGIIENLNRLKDLPIPVLVIRGDQDKTSNNGEQFSKLKQHLNYGEVILKDAGHALPWTHVEGIKDEFQKFINSIIQ